MRESAERPSEGNLAGALLVPRIPTRARKRKRQICFLARGGEGGRSRPAGGPKSRSNFGGGRRVSVRVCLRECI